MSKDQPVTIGARTFQSQKTAKTFFNVMLNRHALGARLGEPDARELLALVERHPDRDAVVGDGAAHFEVVSGALGARCFRVVHRGGTSSDFSVAECVEHTPRDPRAELSARLSEIVAPDLAAARARYLAKHMDDEGMVACTITGNHIMPADGDMAYRAPISFDSIVASFLLDRPELIAGEPIDAEAAQAFRVHHTKAMRLEFVQRHVRLNKKSGAKRKSTAKPTGTAKRKSTAKPTGTTKSPSPHRRGR